MVIKILNYHWFTNFLIRYSFDISVYDWVIENGFWKAKSDLQKTEKLIVHFSSTDLEHGHFNQYDE